MKKIIPKCSNLADYKERHNSMGYRAEGYILPCCWCDRVEIGEKKHENSDPIIDDLLKSLYSPHLHLDNVETIDEILLSDEWLNFINSWKDYETAPKLCQYFCGTNDDEKEKSWKVDSGRSYRE